MQAMVLEKACIQCGLCAGLCPEVFELNSGELARVTVWIGEIQWMLKHGYDCRRNPILARLDHIEHRDALLNEDGSEAEWPAVDAIVGNPPFLGAKWMRDGLGDAYTDMIRNLYA